MFQLVKNLLGLVPYSPFVDEDSPNSGIEFGLARMGLEYSTFGSKAIRQFIKNFVNDQSYSHTFSKFPSLDLPLLGYFVTLEEALFPQINYVSCENQPKRQILVHVVEPTRLKTYI